MIRTGSTDALDPGSCSRNSSGVFLFCELSELSGILLTGCAQKAAGYRRLHAASGNEGLCAFGDFGADRRKAENLAAGVKLYSRIV